ncbi:MAG: tyrosine-type recombinase/integrase [Gammaproteobacteria bacterium]|uniref:Site-specific integrase n=1 Tax=Candidatus Kutchimonas denitrificans TaxID=3056748 RepID=A0AAE4ZAR7_9BACT|nr:site-specific integrase [Candidatus Kutchimonas denitrificans]NIV53559.1 tyrosine-type recombinase/integrase [Gammaproteobacteria bacterium]
MRDPSHPGWPERGEKTEHEDVAEEWAWAYLRHHQGRRWRNQTGQPEPTPALEDATTEYLHHRQRVREENTWVNDQTICNHLIRHFGKARKLGSITSDDLQEWFDERVDEGYSPNTLRTYRKQVRAFFAHYGLGSTVAVELPSAPTEDPRAWTDLEMERLRKAARDMEPHHTLLLETGWCTGARRAELCALRWSDFRQKDRTVRIQRQVSRITSRTKPLKGKRARTALVLPEWWEMDEGTGYVLGGEKPVPTRTVHGWMAEIQERVGLDETGVGVHALRHTYARRILEGGCSIHELKVFLGHASIQTTEMYEHFSTEAAVRLASGRIYG